MYVFYSHKKSILTIQRLLKKKLTLKQVLLKEHDCEKYQYSSRWNITYLFICYQKQNSMYFPIFHYYNPVFTNLQLTNLVPQPQVVPTFSAALSNFPLLQTQQKQIINLEQNANGNSNSSRSQEANPRISRKKPMPREIIDEPFGYRTQNKDRNIMSNILKAFIHHLSDRQGMKNYVEFLCKKFELQNGVSRFYEFVAKNFPKSKSYISSKDMRTFLRNKDHPERLLKIFRLVLNRFYQQQFIVVLLRSTKTKSRSKMEQIKKSRELLANLFKQ